MGFDYSEFFKRYERIVARLDEAFEQVKQAHPDCVKCKQGCSDCCFALFDLSLIEAIYLNHHFYRQFKGQAQEQLLERANRADRKVYKIKKELYRAFQGGEQEEQVLVRAAQERVRCPLLNDEDRCDMYDQRPMTCRAYGIPTAIGGRGHTCGKSGFVEGQPYPTVHLDRIHQELYEVSVDLVRALRSKYAHMAEMMVPLSMAILNEFDEDYLGMPGCDCSAAPAGASEPGGEQEDG